MLCNMFYYLIIKLHEVNVMLKFKKAMLLTAAIISGLVTFGTVDNVSAARINTTAKGDASMIKGDKLHLTNKWDKVFPQSNKVI